MAKFNIRDPQYWRKAAKSYASNIDKILWVGFSLAITVILLRVTKGSVFTVQGVSVPLDFAWVPLAAFTIVHVTYTLHFIRAARKFWNLTEPSTYKDLFIEITSDGGLFMRGMEPRIVPPSGGAAPMGNDLPTWLSYIAAICLFAACVPSSGLFSLGAIPAYILTFINWIAGSNWAIALSELAVEKRYSVILANKLAYGQRVTPTLFDDEEAPDETDKK